MAFKMIGIYRSVFVVGFLLGISGFLQASYAEVVYECSGFTRVMDPDCPLGVGAKKQVSYPTDQHKAEDREAGVFKMVPGAQKATKDVEILLEGGTIFQVFTLSSPNPPGDHMVLRYLNPQTRHMAYQVFPVGIPSIRFMHAIGQPQKVGEPPTDFYEHYTDCVLRGYKPEMQWDLDIKATGDQFECVFDSGQLTVDYRNPKSHVEGGGFAFDFNPMTGKFFSYVTGGANPERIATLTLQGKGDPRVHYEFDWSDYTGWGGRFISQFQDFLLNPKTLEFEGKRILGTTMRHITPVIEGRDGEPNYVCYYDAKCIRKAEIRGLVAEK